MKAHDNKAVPAHAQLMAEHGGAPLPEKKNGALSGPFTLAEQLVKTAGLLAVFGYMELRAHLNYLGISSTASLGLERYLAEFYSMLTDVLFRAQVLSSLILPVILVGAIAFVLVRATDTTGRLRREMKKRFGSMVAHSASAWVPALLVVVLLSFQLWFLKQLSGLFGDGQFVGSLHADSHRLQGANLFYVLFCVVLLASGIAWILPLATVKPSVKWIWKAYWLLVAILALVYLPNLYGAFIREASYPRVSIKSDTAAKMCGLLVLQTTDDMRVWTVSGKIGRIQVVKPSDAGPVVIGAPQDLFALAEDAVNGKSVNYCPE